MHHVEQSCLNEQKYFKILASTFIVRGIQRLPWGKL